VATLLLVAVGVPVILVGAVVEGSTDAEL